MPEVFAGWVIGFALSTLVAPMAAWMLLSSNGPSGFAQRLAPPGTNVIALTMVLHFIGLLVLTALGIVLGLALMGIEDRRPAGGFGSPNLVFTALVVALVGAAVIPTLALPNARRYTIAGGLFTASLFGWAMPWLATLG